MSRSVRGIGRWACDKRWGGASSMSPGWSPWICRASWSWHHGTMAICSLPASSRPFLCPLELFLLHGTWVSRTATHLSCSFYVPTQSVININRHILLLENRDGAKQCPIYTGHTVSPHPFMLLLYGRHKYSSSQKLWMTEGKDILPLAEPSPQT